MPIDKTRFSQFIPYKPIIAPYNKPNIKPKKSIKSLIGASVGVAGAIVLSKKFITDEKIKNKTVRDVAEMLTMAGFANVGAVLATSYKEKKENINKKWKEAAFQMMNTTIPMLMVSGVLELCKKTKMLSGKIPRAIASILAMVSGAAAATKITNMTKDKNEPKRKYTIKDSVANFDDIVATIKIGFSEIEKYVPVAKILPFIYIYCGSRAGDAVCSAANEEKHGN